jgi:hypothetical protein
MKNLDFGDAIIIFIAITALYYPIASDLLIHKTEIVNYGTAFFASIVIGMLLTVLVILLQNKE